MKHARANAGTTGRYVAAALVLCAAVARGGQPEPLGPATSEALALCHEADRVPAADDPRMRLMLANVLWTSGERDQALAHATIALGILEHAGSASELADARGFVAGLR